jgi:hypothetical protein
MRFRSLCGPLGVFRGCSRLLLLLVLVLLLLLGKGVGCLGPAQTHPIVRTRNPTTPRFGLELPTTTEGAHVFLWDESSANFLLLANAGG